MAAVLWLWHNCRSHPSLRLLIMHKSPAVEHCIELLCGKGCRQVWHEIHRLENGEDVAETLDLSTEERRIVLRELKAIMAVYAERCSID
jgi:hypothetical protein